MTLLSKLQRIVQDPLFWRVAVCLFGLPFAGFGIAGIVALSPPEGWWWAGVLLLAALAAYGAFLVYAACLGSEELVERATGSIHDGGDLLGLVFVLVIGAVAIPITLLLRWLHPRPS